MPTSVNLPFQALVDDGLLDAERLTLAILYAYADEDGIVMETPMSLEIPRVTHRNTVRRHIGKLQKLRYLIPLKREGRLDRTPQRRVAQGYALTLSPSGERWPAAKGGKEIGSKGWNSRRRWS